MSNKVKQIDLLNRNSLVMLAKKLQIKGYTNNFKSPYRNKDYLKNEIQNSLKLLKKRSKSVSNFHQSGGTNNENHNLKHILPATALKRSKSCSDIYGTPRVSDLSQSDLNLIQQNKSCYFPKKRKIVAIGDIHGDMEVAIKTLKLAGVISKSIPDTILDIRKINWEGGDTFVVQMGDQIDRVRPGKLFNSLCTEYDSELVDDEGSDLKIMCLFSRLNKQAQQVGGACLGVLGNHELMNVDGDFRYVSPKEFHEFGNFFKGKMEYDSNVPFGYKERKEAFMPGGTIAKMLANDRYSIVQVGSWIFVHGGISPKCANNYSLDDINKHIQNWLLGDNSGITQEHVHNLYHLDDDDDSPFWSRIYSDMDEWNGMESVKDFIKMLNMINVKNIRKNDTAIKGIVMGHSPQFMYGRGINSSAKNRIWRVDVGASKAFGKMDQSSECKHRVCQVLVIENDNNFSIVKEMC